MKYQQNPQDRPPEEIAEEEERLAELRRQEIARLEVERTAQFEVKLAREVQIQNIDNELALLEFGDREEVQNVLSVVTGEEQRLRAELNDTGLSAEDQQRLQDLMVYQETLEDELDRISGRISSLENERIQLQANLDSANTVIVANSNQLNALDYDYSQFTEPTTSEVLVDWSDYDYQLPPFNQTDVPSGDFTNVVVSTVSLPVTSGNVRYRGALISEDGSSVSYDDWGVDEARSEKLDDFEHLYYGTGTDGLQWIYGVATTPEQFALRTGTATFSGGLSGYYAHGTFDSNTVYEDSVMGELALIIDFGSNRLTGEGRVEIDTPVRSETLSFSLNEAAITQAGGLTRSLRFSSSATLENGASGNGNFSGTFYGSDASEAAGSFAFGLSGGFAAGVWAAGENYVPGEGNEESSYSGAFVLGYAASSNGHGSAWRAVNDIFGGEIILSGGQTGADNSSVDIATTFTSNGYSHVSWGMWQANNTTPTPLADYGTGYWVDVDNVTASSVLENRTGSAQFAGEIRGGYVGGGNVEEDAQGLINITVDFSDQSVGGQFQFGRSCSGSGLSGCSIASEVQSFNEPIDDYSGSGFGNHARVGSSGVIGVFGGETGQEIGGHAWIEENNGQYVGVFQAREGLSFGDFANPTDPIDPPLTFTQVFTGHARGYWPSYSNNSSQQARLRNSQLYTTSNAQDSLVTGRNELSANQAFYTSGNSGLVIETSAASRGSYSFTDWGTWDSTSANVLDRNGAVSDRGYWVIGANTHESQMPRSGTATYNGEAIGTDHTGAGIAGTARLQADFSADTIDAQLNLNRNGSSWASVTFAPMGIVAPSDSSAIGETRVFNGHVGNGDGAITGLPSSSDAFIGGTFYGDQAQEVGGYWGIGDTTGDGTFTGAEGVFRATQ